ncbi:MAG TPA: hypothetical protein VMT04_05125, partial [Terriglobales bacterium]|nr:hypothetical protein [Terriglobales bacterium]
MQVYSKIIALILFMILPVLGNGADSTNQGTYVPNIVLSAQWGEKNLSDNNELSKPGTFGLSENAQGIPIGPTAFKVASNGDIYISDIINNRVQRFSSAGSFIGVIPNVRVGFDEGMSIDKEGNIYTGNFRIAHPYVEKIDLNGNLVCRYPIATDPEMGTDKPTNWGAAGNILVDDSGRVFIQYEKDRTNRMFQVGTKDAPFSPAQQKASWKEGYMGITANPPNGNRAYAGYLLGMDTEADYEIEQAMKNYEPDKDVSIIKKFQKGKLVATYTLNWK